MQNTTLGQVITELQQQYEAVGNIPVKMLENEQSLVLVYDEQLVKEQMYIAMATLDVGDAKCYMVSVDSCGDVVRIFGDKSEAVRQAIKLGSSKIHDFAGKLNFECRDANIKYYVYEV